MFLDFQSLVFQSIVSLLLRNHDGDTVDNVDQKMNLYFTYESRDTLKLFSLFLTVKAISKLNMERSVKFGI